MKRICVSVVFLFAAFSAWSQQTEVREPGSFSGVKVQEGISVFLERGEKEMVRIEVEGTDLSNILTEISGEYLKIHRKGNFFGNVEVRAYVTYVDIDKLSASSAGSIYSETPVKAQNMLINVSSAGSVDIVLAGGSARVTSSSAGEVELKGSVKSAVLAVSSAGQIDAFDLEAEEVQANASSGGSMKFNVSRTLKAHASSGGSIRYRGNPQRSDTNSTSGGSVRKL